MVRLHVDMTLSTRAIYGLRLLYQLAKNHSGSPLQMREVSERENISEKYLGQIVILLKSKGLVQAVRGAQGGYYLSRPPDMIRLLEIIECLEGEILPQESLGLDGQSSSESERATEEVWNGLRGTIRDYLEGISLADLLSSQARRNQYGDYVI